MAVGLPLGPATFITTCVQQDDILNKTKDLREVETSAKLIQVLNDKYAERLEHLDNNSINYGDYRFEIASEEIESKRQEYAKRYDAVINRFGEYEAVKLIDKQQFVDYMMKNGDRIDEFVNSEEFYGILLQIKDILDDPITTKEEKLDKAKEVVHAEAKFLSDPTLETYDRCVLAFGIISGISTIIGMFYGVHFLPDSLREGTLEMIHYIGSILFGMVVAGGFMLAADIG